MNDIQKLALPRDLWVMTLRNNDFSAVDLVHLKRVCRLFYEIIQATSFQSVWQLRFETDFDPTRFKYWVNVNWQQKYNAYAIEDKEKTIELNYYKQICNTDVAYDPRRALKWLKVMIDHNNASQEEIEAALSFLNKNPNNLDSELEYFLSCLLMKKISRGDPFSVPVNLLKGFDLLEKSAKRGFPKAQLKLAIINQTTFGSLINAHKWAKRAADQGLAEAYTTLSKYYYEGIGTTVDMAEAFRCAQIAADSGCASGQFNVGTMYELGQGTAVDKELALHYYTLAANNGHAEAQHKVGAYYINAPEPIKDIKKGLTYLISAADQGLDQAMFNLAKCIYCMGDKTENYLATCYRYLEKAAKQGNSDAQYVLEGFVKDKDGKITDLDCDFRYSFLAAKAGDPVGQLQMGIRYLYGQGVEKNLEEALRYFKLAADQGVVEAQQMVQAAEHGHPKAIKWLQEIG